MINILKKNIWNAIWYDIINKPYLYNIYFDWNPVILPITWPENVDIKITKQNQWYKYHINNIEVDKQEYNDKYKEEKNKYFQYDDYSECEIPITIHSRNERDNVKGSFEITEVLETVELEYEVITLDYCKSEYSFIIPLPKTWDSNALYEFKWLGCAEYMFKSICDQYDITYWKSQYEFDQYKPMNRKIGWKTLLRWMNSYDYQVTQSAVDTYDWCLKRYKETESILKPVILNTIASLSKKIANKKTLWNIVDMIQNINIQVYWWWKKDISDRNNNKEKLLALKKCITDVILENDIPIDSV